MLAFEYFLPRPPFQLESNMQVAFDGLFHSTRPGSVIEYRLPYPKWQFLSYLCETRDLVLHGSPVSGIELVEPRQANDVRAYSPQDSLAGDGAAFGLKGPQAKHGHFDAII